jgi:hypothetical protein
MMYSHYLLLYDGLLLTSWTRLVYCAILRKAAVAFVLYSADTVATCLFIPEHRVFRNKRKRVYVPISCCIPENNRITNEVTSRNRNHVENSSGRNENVLQTTSQSKSRNNNRLIMTGEFEELQFERRNK